MDIAALFANLHAMIGPARSPRRRPLDYEWRMDGETTLLLSRDVASVGADVGVVRQMLESIAADDAISRIVALLDQATANAGLRVGLIESASHLGRVAADGRLSARMACVVDPSRNNKLGQSTNCLLGFGIAPGPVAMFVATAPWPTRGVLIFAGERPLPENRPDGLTVQPLGVDVGDGPLYAAWWGVAP